MIEFGVLGSPMMDIGLEKTPNPGILMKGIVLLDKWAVLVMGLSLPMVAGMGLSWSPSPKLLMKGPISP